MSGTQKPFANDRTPAAQPQPARKKGSLLGKVVKLVLFVAVVGAIASMAWQGKRLGEERARAAGQDLAAAKMVWPWEWTTPQWEGWFTTVKMFGQQAEEKAKTAGLAAKEKIATTIAEFKKSRSGGTTTTATTPAPATTGTTPAAAPETPAPAGFEDAAKLVEEGEAAWEAHNFDAAKAKLTEAIAKLKPLAEQKPVNPKVEKALDLANQLLEDMAAR